MIILALGAGAFADAYRNPAPTAEGIAKSGAMMIFSDDASAISYNPANLAGQTNASVVIAADFAQSENTYSPVPGVELVSDHPWVVLPNLYVSLPVAENLVAGLGITTPFGQGVSWNAADFSPALAPTPYDATLMLVNINPSLALNVSDSVMLGAGVDIFYSELELKALFPGDIPSEADSDGVGYGVNFGVTVKPADRHYLALTYRSRVDVDYEGDFTLGGIPAGDFETTIKFPNIYGAGYGIEITDDIQVEALIEWIQWSVNDIQSLTIGGAPLPQVNNWDDTITAAVGGSWQFADHWVFRAGYTYIETPIPDSTITPVLPDTDRHIFGVGLGYTIAGHGVDLAYAYTYYEDKSSPPGSTAPGTYEIDSNLIGLTYSYSF